MRSLSNVWKAPALIAALICGCGGGGGEADQKDAIEQEETYFDADSSEISGNDLEEIETLPDPAFFFKVDKHSKVVSDDEYAEEFSALYRTADKLKELDVRVIAVKEGNVFAGTSNGIFFYDKEEDSFINLKTISEDFSVLDGAVVDIAVCAEIDVGYDIFAYADRIVILTTGELGGIFVVSAPEGEIIKSAGAEASCGKFWFGTNKGLHAVSGDLT
ncbi:MAG: hypothetical protein FJ088_11135, partial [Deltaproteobacteria bacterium]|nr:hypothetical protein [Deltaproteobacteria bacterium]